MKLKITLKKKSQLVWILGCLSIFYGCEFFPEADLVIDKIEFHETFSNSVVDLPDGIDEDDIPNFSPTIPETWTGSITQYVKHNRLYRVQYSIRNVGDATAYDTEIDLSCYFDNDDDVTETIYIGDMPPGTEIESYTFFQTTNKKMVECLGEVFWYEDY